MKQPNHMCLLACVITTGLGLESIHAQEDMIVKRLAVLWKAQASEISNAQFKYGWSALHP